VVVVGSPPVEGQKMEEVAKIPLDVLKARNMSLYWDYIVGLNGLWDLACSFAILLGIGLGKVHTSIFFRLSDQQLGGVLGHRLLAYWLLTYGSIRMAAFLYPSVPMHFLCSLTYFLEFAVYAVEWLWWRSTFQPVLFICLASLALGLVPIMGNLQDKENF